MTENSPQLRIVEQPVQSVLWIGTMVRIELPRPMPGWWRRFWYWALLGWRFEEGGQILMPTPTPHYDPQCEKLARRLLDEDSNATEDDVYRLAYRLQETAEEYRRQLRSR